MSDLTQIENDEILKPFFECNKEFDVLNFNWFDKDKVEKLKWEEDWDKDKISDRLKAYQRLLRLGLDPSDAKNFLDASQEPVQGEGEEGEMLLLTSPEDTEEQGSVLAIDSIPDDVVFPLVGSAAPKENPSLDSALAIDSIADDVVFPVAGSAAPKGTPSLDSALAIASTSEAEFVQTSNLDPEKAREVHRNATQTTARSMVLLANAMQFGSPRVGSMLGDNAAQIRENFKLHPSYQELFGSLDYLQCDPCQSIFSPAAYFVDLMRIVEQYITQPNNIPINGKLSDRRPDLKNIPLTCDNTQDTVPYTQIVSEVLAEKLKNDLRENAFRHLATAKYPRHLPFNLYLEQIRTYLSHLNTNLADIYESFHPQERRSNVWAREYLGFSQKEYNLITTANTGDLSDRYGVNVSTDNKFGGLITKKTFLKQTGLALQELKDLFYQNLSSEEVKSNAAHQFYINKKLSGNEYLKLNDQGKIENINGETLDRVDRFLRLAHKLDWSFADLDWVLTSIEVEDINEEAITKIAKIKQLQATTKLPLDVLCSFWYEMKALGKGDNPNRPQDLFDRIFNNPLILHGQEKYDPNSAIAWKIDRLDIDTDKENSRLTIIRLLAALQLSDRELSDIVEGIWNGQTDIELNVANLSRLFRTSQILKLLGLNVGEYKLLLKFLNQSFTSLEKLEIDKLTEIIEFAQWLKVSGFSLYELDYILNGTVHPSVEVFLPEEEMTSFMESLWQKHHLPNVEWHLSEEDLKLITTPDASPESLSQRYGVDISQNLGRLAQRETFLKQTNLSEQELRDLLYQNLSQEEINSGKAHQFYINKKLSDNKYLNLSSECKIANLNLDTLDRVDRFLRLARKLNWSFADLDWVLALTEAEDINSNAILEVTEIKRLQEQTNLPLAEIRSVYDSLKGKVKDAKIESKILVIAVQEKHFSPQIAIHFGMEVGVFSVLAQLATQIVKNNVWAKNYVELLLTKPEVKQDTKVKQDNKTWKKIVNFLKFISRTRLFVGKLGLTEIEVRSVCDRPEAYNIKSLSDLKRKFVRIDSLSKLSEKLSKGVSWLVNKIIGKTADEIFEELQTDLADLLDNEEPDWWKQLKASIRVDEIQLSVKDIRHLHKFKKQLVASFNQPEKTLLGYLENPATEQLAKLTGWKQEQINRTIEYFYDRELYKSVEGLLKLKQCFDLCAALGCNINFLCDLCGLLENGSTANNWKTYQKLASSVISLAKAKYDNEEWAKVFGKLNGTLEERKCKILTELALQELGKENPRELSEHLMLDVEMTSCACNSRIQLAILSVQTYLQRCRMGLEPGVTQVNIPTVWWEWIMNYRKWEANRKVFLYPENYIDPSLRKNASPIFKELQDELLQSEITAETVEAAYRNYFDKFAELAKLQIVDGCRYWVQTPKSDEPVDTLFIFAKTITQPHTFYYRRCEYRELKQTEAEQTEAEQSKADKPFWGYWEKIDLQINSEYLAPVYAFDRLFIFWVETKEIQKSQDVSPTTQATIKYSFLNASQKWVSPQTLVADVEILEKFRMGVDETFWQQVYPLVDKTLDSQSSPEIAILWGGISPTLSRQFDEKSKLLKKTVIPIAKFAIDLLPVAPLSSSPTKLELSEVRDNLAATTIENLVVFAGGQKDNNSYSKKIDIFAFKNRELKRQETLELSEGRNNLAVVTVGNLVVFAGGYNGSSYSKKVDIFAFNNGELKRQETLELSEERGNLAAATVGNLVIFAGGLKANSSYSNKVDIFAFNNGELKPPKTPNSESSEGQPNLELSEGRDNLAVATVGNLVVFAGGYNGSSYSKKVDIFAFNNGELKRQKTLELSEERDNLAAAIIGNSVVFAGGYNGSSYSQTIDVFAVNSEQIKRQKTVIQLSEKRSNLAATTVGNLVVFAGGYNGSSYSQTIDVFYAFNSDLTFNTLPSNLQLPTDTSVIPIKNHLQGFIFQRHSEAFSTLSGQASDLTRLTTSTIQQFSSTLFATGLDGLLSLESQQISEPYFPLVSNNKLDFDGAYGAYFWEIFFHVPFLIASTLNAHQRYNEARQWYQYIFNPTIPGDDSDKERFWRFLPFRGQTLEKLKEILTNEATIKRPVRNIIRTPKKW